MHMFSVIEDIKLKGAHAVKVFYYIILATLKITYKLKET